MQEQITSNDEMKTFIKLKYKFPIQNSRVENLALYKLYPREAVKKWVWRCIDDATSLLIIQDKRVSDFIKLGKNYADGLRTRDEFITEFRKNRPAFKVSQCICEAVWAAAFIAEETSQIDRAVDGCCEAFSAWNTLHKQLTGIEGKPTAKEKWKEYTDWLIEELHRYETQT